jgi:hypothetical protein
LWDSAVPHPNTGTPDVGSVDFAKSGDGNTLGDDARLARRSP